MNHAHVGNLKSPRGELRFPTWIFEKGGSRRRTEGVGMVGAIGGNPSRLPVFVPFPPPTSSCRDARECLFGGRPLRQRLQRRGINRDGRSSPTSSCRDARSVRPSSLKRNVVRIVRQRTLRPSVPTVVVSASIPIPPTSSCRDARSVRPSPLKRNVVRIVRQRTLRPSVPTGFSHG